ncbi:hypothetical protein [Streptomyces sp. NPDC055287]
MAKNSTSAARSKWTGMVPDDDMALALTDTGGPRTPVVCLNGQFATQGYGRRVISALETGWRHIPTSSGPAASRSDGLSLRSVTRFDGGAISTTARTWCAEAATPDASAATASMMARAGIRSRPGR